MIFILKRIKIKYLGFCFIAFIALILTGVSAFGKTSKKTEKYSATVDDGTLKVMSSYTPLDDDNPLGDLHDIKIVESDDANKTDEDEIKSRNLPRPKPRTLEAKTESKPDPNSFDPIPSQHVDNIAKRIKYAYEIAKRFNRAYDYRTTTLSQFQKILEDLELDDHQGNPNKKKN